MQVESSGRSSLVIEGAPQDVLGFDDSGMLDVEAGEPQDVYGLDDSGIVDGESDASNQAVAAVDKDASKETAAVGG
ncbi:hypothetical protein HOLleu_10811 [Holothuria leucospilota]|uniref:Uncharacterized protein n=1 Tax=Holothuria leucospilota TaxID=206669 RepID=A0A9Q1CF80_HOLLE|nr:hypothetical protein HOLleu_10811 [Holothuria leucospilota]